MTSIDVMNEIAREAARLNRRWVGAMFASGILTGQVALAVLVPERPSVSGLGFLVVGAAMLWFAFRRWSGLQAALGGLEVSSWPLHRPTLVRPRPVDSVEQYRPLARWLVPGADHPAPHGLVSAVQGVLERDEALAGKYRECVASNGTLTIYDAVNLLYLAQALERRPGVS